MQSFIYILALFLYFLLKMYNYKQIFCLFLTCVWFMFNYWSFSTSEILDSGLNNKQTKKDYCRWYRFILDFIYDKLNKEKYIGFYDFWYSSIRNLIAVIPFLFISFKYILLVPIMYPIYLLCNKLFIKYNKLYENDILIKLKLNEPKNIAELLHGLVVGIIFCL